MPLTQGAMPDWQQSKIKRNYRFLKREIDARDLLDFFMEAEIFDFPDLDAINGYNPDTKENRNNCFFRLIANAGPTAYEVFLNALRNNGQEYVANKLEETEPAGGAIGVENDDLPCWYADVPCKVKDRRLKERELSRLAPTLGSDWELVASEMGLSKADIDHAKMDNMTAAMKIYACLSKWKSRAVGKATLDNFIQILSVCQSTTIHWEQIKTIVAELEKENV